MKSPPIPGWLIYHADLPPGERWVCFRTREELRDALMQLDGAKRVVGDALVRASEANR